MSPCDVEVLSAEIEEGVVVSGQVAEYGDDLLSPRGAPVQAHVYQDLRDITNMCKIVI